MNAIDLSTTPIAATPKTTSETTKTAAKAKQSRRRRPWTPSPLDLQTFERVRMQGEKQLDVALGLGISQSTVSRMVRRVERWQSRSTPREAGRLEHGERLRAQLWLTFERNELLMASCLRIAARMESQTHRVHKHTTQQSHATGEKTTDASVEIETAGVAARFLRLAFRINMEQLKLARQDELPPLPPLSAEELEEEELDSAAAAAELQASLQQFREADDQETGDGDQEPVVGTLRVPSPADEAAAENDGSRSEPATLDDGSGSEPAKVLNVHKVHQDNGPASGASDDPAGTYAKPRRREKTAAYARIERAERTAKRPKPSVPAVP